MLTIHSADSFGPAMKLVAGFCLVAFAQQSAARLAAQRAAPAVNYSANTRASARYLLHTHLIKSEPAANDTLATAPRALRLWFTERVELAVTTVKLTGAAGAAIALAPLARPDTGERAPIVAALTRSLAPGSYVVNWSTAAKDGHPARGSYPFVVRGEH